MKNASEISNQLNSLEPRLIGRIGVDLAQVWIGDPLFLNEGNLDEIKFGECGAKCKPFKFENEREGLGVKVHTGTDGKFNVIGFFNPEDVEGNEPPFFVLIDFVND